MTRRTKTRAYLLLARVSNLPTVWTNVLAAFGPSSRGAFEPSTVATMSQRLAST